MSQVSERAVIQRMNRRLHTEYERVSKIQGRYMIVNRFNSIVAESDDLEAWARECGALAEHEAIA